MDGLGHGMPGVEPEVRDGGSNSAGIVLSIDKDIQTVIQNVGNRELKKGAIVVMDPYNGEIKGAASFPSFTPTDLEKSIKDTENSPMINRAFLPFNVGSTFKIVTAAAALEAGIPMSEIAVCTGSCLLYTSFGLIFISNMIFLQQPACLDIQVLGEGVGGHSRLDGFSQFGWRADPLPALGDVYKRQV